MEDFGNELDNGTEFGIYETEMDKIEATKNRTNKGGRIPENKENVYIKTWNVRKSYE